MYGELFAAFQAGRAPSLPTRQLAGTALVQIAAAELVRAGGGSVEIEPEGSIL
jgi:hypothetical protein